MEEIPNFREVSVHPHRNNESKDSLILRVVEAFTPKGLDLPVSIQNLKDAIDRKRIEKIA